MEQDTEKQEEQTDEEVFENAFDEFAGDKVEEPAEEDASDESEEETEEFDESQLPESVRKELEKHREAAKHWEHKYRSDAGRVSALQKQVNEFKSSQETKPTDQQLKEALSSDQGWQEFKEDFPEAAGALETQFGTLAQNIEERLAPVQKQAQQAAEQNDYQKQIQTLSASKEQGGYGHGDYQEIIYSEDFKKWGKQQHPSVQELFNSTEAADAAYVLDLYKAMKGGEQQQQQKREEISQKRKKRQQRNIHVEGQAATPKAGPPDDFDGAFEYFAAKK